MQITDLASPAIRQPIAAKIGCNEEYLWQIGTGRRKASPRLCSKLEAATGMKLDRYKLRPDIYGKRPKG